jgi:choice-of-anchor B domain-containing protein
MKRSTILFLIVIATKISAQTNVEFVSSLNPGSSSYSDIWGYVDQSGNEYAILGAYNGTYIINLIDQASPRVSALIPGPQSIWRDMKVHQNYAYIVTEGRGNGQGLQIVDLSGLPNTATLVNTVDKYFTGAHNIFIDNGFAFVVGTENGGGMHILDLSNPTSPVQTAYYTGSNYVHDVYVWNDTVVACAANSYDLIDITDKYNPFKISESVELPGIYAHSGWMTEDKRYFYAAEEFNVRDITVWDLQDRSSWNLVVSSWQNKGDATVHNIFIKGNYAHISYYSNGYVVLDISSPETPFLVGEYDTNPLGPISGYTEAWGCYPFFPSGNTLISSIEEGLFVLKFTPGDVPPSIYSERINTVFNNEPVKITSQIVDNSAVVETNLFYRTIIDNKVGNWNVVSGTFKGNNQYEFTIPGFPHLTEVEYYIAALDDSGKIRTLPTGGSGTEPAGKIAPSQYLTYEVIITGPPVILSSNINTDTTVSLYDEFDITVYAQDTTGLELDYEWLKNGLSAIGTKNTYHYRAALNPANFPRIDSVKSIVSNGYFETTRTWYITVLNATGVDNDKKINSYYLEQNYPNPFNPATTLTFSLPEAQFANLAVYNLIGEKIAVLVNENLASGLYKFEFDANNLQSGIYFAKLTAGNYTKTIKMTLIK